MGMILVMSVGQTKGKMIERRDYLENSKGMANIYFTIPFGFLLKVKITSKY